eukprot:785685-Prorocentrum_minimum.AAC.2
MYSEALVALFYSESNWVCIQCGPSLAEASSQILAGWYHAGFSTVPRVYGYNANPHRATIADLLCYRCVYNSCYQRARCACSSDRHLVKRCRLVKRGFARAPAVFPAPPMGFQQFRHLTHPFCLTYERSPVFPYALSRRGLRKRAATLANSLP